MRRLAATNARAAPLVLLALTGACASHPAPAPGPAPAPWRELFDGRSLAGFVATDFGGQGEVEVRDGRLHLGFGSPLTGVTWTGAPPAGEYDLEVVAARELGSDFFCGLTFPVGDAHLTLVLGGWGGVVCGLSSLDGNDAAHNRTRSARHFVVGVEHCARVEVRVDRVRVVLDGEVLCSIDPREHRLGLRPEVLLSRPLGIASFATAATVRTLRWRPAPR